MLGGLRIERQFVLVSADGAIIIDWGDGLYQDVHNGGFSHLSETEISHQASDDDMYVLKRFGKIAHYDTQYAYFLGLPERPYKLID